MTIVVHKFTAPSAWASYLINGDATEDSLRVIEAWVESIGFGPPVSCEHVGFMWDHDAREFAPYGADCEEYVFYERVSE